jgi:hypothetical protein
MSRLNGQMRIKTRAYAQAASARALTLGLKGLRLLLSRP